MASGNKSVTINNHQFQITKVLDGYSIDIKDKEQCDYLWGVLKEINENKSQQKQIISTLYDADYNQNIPYGLYTFKEIFIGNINDKNVKFVNNKKTNTKEMIIRKDQDETISIECSIYDSERYVVDIKDKQILYLMVNIEIKYKLSVEAKIKMETKLDINRHTISNPDILQYVACIKCRFDQDPYQTD